jgi:hypothetical protein
MKVMNPALPNPFRPGAGHPPPFLAGRQPEIAIFEQLLRQQTILTNVVLTGLRGVGKTVLLDTFKPIAQASGWLWVGTDISESTSLTDGNLSTRLITDMATVTSGIVVRERTRKAVGFDRPAEQAITRLDVSFLNLVFAQTAGLVADKLKAVLELVAEAIQTESPGTGIVFAYDEAQNLSDNAAKDQFPLSLLLDVFQSIQKRGVRFLLVLTGLPTLFPKLVDARTFSERMFRVLFLDRLTKDASREAILEPIKEAQVQLTNSSVEAIIKASAGYPYFIQFICRDVYDAFLADLQTKGHAGPVPINAIIAKLDTDFFAGRWARITDRQRDLLIAIARVAKDAEFTVSQAVEGSQLHLAKPFSSSHVNQMLSTLADGGLIYKNRHGRYSFAVPLFGDFVLRNTKVG